MKFYLCGDVHGRFEQIKDGEFPTDKNAAIVILGDFGANFFKTQRDKDFKTKMNNYGCRWYAVKGNHDARPSTIDGMELIYDEDVDGEVWMESEFPNIRYFKEFGVYQLGRYRCAVIGGAYSVDKWYRLANHWTWYADEQLNDDEKKECEDLLRGQDFDFVFTHTCPFEWQPIERFLNTIDQSQIDHGMEKWLANLKDTFNWMYWVFGHYHDDQLVRPYVEMYYTKYEALDTIAARWDRYRATGELEWWLKKSPYFYMN